MMGKVLFTIMCITVLSYKAWSEDNLKEDSFKKDPFKPPFVKEEGGYRPSSLSVKKIEGHPRDLEVEVKGIIVGGKLKQAIIDGELYEEGDVLKNIDAKIVKIDKERVSIMFEGVLYEKSVEK